MNVGYLINTHAGYLRPLNHLLHTFPLHLQHHGHVLVVSGGNPLAGIPRLQKYRGCHLLEVEHDSWDYTGLIELVLAPDSIPFFRDHTHFFCLQDTMEFGEAAHEKISAADPAKWATAAFGGQCNLVLYEKGYLLAMRNFILARRNNTKLQSIEQEGALWKLLTQNLSRRHEATFPPGTHEVVGKGTPYGGAERIKEYYLGVDIGKWKANYGQNMNSLIVKP